MVTGSSGRGLKRGFYKGATISKAHSHHAVNTGNKGAKVSKDTLCFRGGGTLPVAKLKVFSATDC